jgi:predicted acyltransferase
MGTLDKATGSTSERLVSIDALRGFDMFWIVGGEGLAEAIAGWIGEPTKSFAHEQLTHAAWAGFHFYDLIFPLFLFLVGVVLPFSLGKLRDQGQPRAAAYRRVIRRTILLFFLGLVYYGFLQFNPPSQQRYAGVLQRIALCYFFAALLYLNTRVRGQLFALVAILAGYWALLAFVPPPDSTRGDFSKQHNLSGWVDRHYLPGKIFKDYYEFGDNEGLLSTIPAIGTALLGVLAGTWLRSRWSKWLKLLGLLAAGGFFLGLGYAWCYLAPSPYRFPIIKNIWTSTFVLWAGGWSLLLLALFYAIIDILRLRAWSFFFVVIGMNAITIYMAARILNFSRLSRFFFEGIGQFAGACFGAPAHEVVLAAGAVALAWLLVYHLYRQRLFLRV